MYQALTMYRGLTEMNFQQWRVGVALATGMGLAFVTAVPFQFVAWAQSSGDRMRIAVLDFDFGSTGAAGGYFGGAEARGVNEILVNRLVQDGTYSVIERSQLDAILQEQDLGASGRVDANTAAQIGRILGVDAIVTGTVTEYNLDQQVSGGSVGFFGVSAATDDKTATVKLNARMIGTSTAEILVAAEGEGTATQSDSQVLVLGTGGGSQTNTVQKLLSEAPEQAVV
ncbi:MAG: CsgG/HfaB family protein, partial [Cyanobacteria bacterium P01_E01_bin.48]